MAPRDRQILRLAIPSIVSNITVPLLGLADVAIVGHIGDAGYIAAIAVGSMIFNVMYWLFGFLRMGTSGLTSQALGKRDLRDVAGTLLRSVAVALAVAAVILVAQRPIRYIAFALCAPEPGTQVLAAQYFDICVWGAPAMLVLYSMSGWYVGMQNTRLPMVISILQNVFNIAASLLFVFGLKWQVRGVAMGTVLAQYAGAFLAIILWLKYYYKLHRHMVAGDLADMRQLSKFFDLNKDIFLRTLCLVAVNFFFLSAGSRQGNLILAVNTLLMQFYIMYSYFMDGFAFAGEAMCGKYYGANDASALQDTIRHVFKWGCIVMVLFFISYLIGGKTFVSLLTNDAKVVGATHDYFGWTLAIPVFAMAAFIWDGVFIGLTASKGMLLSSAVATAFFFAIVVMLTPVLMNHGLWLAFIVYLAIRGIVQTWIYFVKIKK